MFIVYLQSGSSGIERGWVFVPHVTNPDLCQMLFIQELNVYRWIIQLILYLVCPWQIRGQILCSYTFPDPTYILRQAFLFPNILDYHSYISQNLKYIISIKQRWQWFYLFCSWLEIIEQRWGIAMKVRVRISEAHVQRFSAVLDIRKTLRPDG